MSSVFADVQLVPAAVTSHTRQVNQSYIDDTSPNKVDLGRGVFRNDESKPWVLPVVAKVEVLMAQDISNGTLNHEYLETDGLQAFSEAACKLLLGDDNPAIAVKRVFGAQAISGTGSIRIGMDFLKKCYASPTVYIPNPDWDNHVKISKAAGYINTREYRYYHSANKALDYEGMIEDLGNAPEKSIIILHACAHNPTGCDPNQEQWKAILTIVKKRKLFPFFDTAYQGFATGDPDVDAWAVRHFVSEGLELFAAQSFAKNFGLYNERAGNLCVVTMDSDTAERIRSQLKAIIRPTWSNPPNHGARIVTTVLNSPALYSEWRENLKFMTDRIFKMRQLLHNKLKEVGAAGKWNHLVEQKGMFGYSGLDANHVKFLAEKRHIYMLNSGRINICGITPNNVDYVARAICEALTVVS